jgi:hypothetical protein
MAKAIVEKVLRSGLVDKATATLMEQWGYLEPGASEKVNEGALEGATKETLNKLANDLASEVERQYILKETILDLERIRWPVDIDNITHANGDRVTGNLKAVIDRMGRYYFRFEDVSEGMFVPGFILERKLTGPFNSRETILEKQILYIDDVPVCVQVSTAKLVTNGLQAPGIVS